MILKKRTSAIPFFVLIAAALLLTGCSICGFTAGVIAESSYDDNAIVQCSAVKTVRPGTAMDVMLKDGNSINGELLGMKSVACTDYAETCANSLSLPSLGNVVVDFKEEASNRRLEGTLIGFDPGVIIVHEKETNERTVIPTTLLDKIVDQRGVAMEGQILNTLMETGKVPFRSSMVVRTESGMTTIDMNKVKFIRSDSRRDTKLTGLLIGAAVEVVAVLLVAKSVK